LGEYQKILEGSPQFLKHNPGGSSSEAYFKQAQQLFDQQLYPAASRIYREILINFAHTEGLDQAQFRLAESLSRNGDLPQAMAQYQKLAEQYPESPYLAMAYYRQGSILYYQKRYSEAIPYLEKAINQADSPTEVAAPAQYLIGICYQQLNNIPELTRAFQQVIQHYPEHTFTGEERLGMGIQLQKQKLYEPAISAFKQVIKNAADNKLKTEAQYWIGECYQLQGQLKQAILEYLKVTYLHSEEDMWAVTARFKAGEAYQQLGQWEEAIKLFQKIARDHKDTTQGQYAARRIELLKEQMEQGD
jgi:tetratricopeptide (TPR) repeat protein